MQNGLFHALSGGDHGDKNKNHQGNAEDDERGADPPGEKAAQAVFKGDDHGRHLFGSKIVTCLTPGVMD